MFVHLHNHSEYSLLNGTIRIPELVSKAKEWGMPAVALTDYGNIFGAVDFFVEAKRKGVKPIMGCVVFHPSHDQHDLRAHRRGVDHLYHLLLLVCNHQGYRNLCQLISQSYLTGFYYKPRVDTSLLKKYSEGLIALSGGWLSALNQNLFEGQRDKALEYLRLYASIYPQSYYVEIQENHIEGQHEMNLELIDMAVGVGVPVVATNNCHYLEREDSEAFETLLCIQSGMTLHGTADQLKFSTDGYYFKSPQEMEAEFAYAPEALDEATRIADLCHFDFDFKTYHFPRFDAPAGSNLDSFLRQEASRGLKERWPEILRQKSHRSFVPVPQDEASVATWYESRLDQELEMIQKMGFAGYFLIVADFIRYAKNEGIPVGPGRGSAAGSLVAYCIRITDIDPLPYNLLFERFLNPERISMPDVDIDFCMNGRDRVLGYVAKKYGNVSQIITFGKMKARAAIRDVGRVMEMPYGEVDKIAKLVPHTLNITLEEAIKVEPRLREMIQKNPQVARLFNIARRLEGLNRHASTHAAGVVISDRDLNDFLPLYKGSNGDVVTQFDMKAVEKIGLIKFDFLGLKTLTVIQDALKIIKEGRGLDMAILDIALDDPEVYQLICRGDTSGVFQLESSGMKDLMVRMKISCFEDLIALVALYRPGPLGSGMVDDFISRKQGKKDIAYIIPQLKPILHDTYGVIVYQEQVMQIASVLAGYSLGEADILRRAMGKKKPKEMAAQRLRFLQGCLENKIPRASAERIFDLMAKFAEYGFNKSHSAAYALVSYQTAFLKAHFPVEYLAAILTTEMQNTDRILYYIQDAIAHGIKILPPDINESSYGFTVVDNKSIRFGLGAVKNVGCGAIESILAIRQKVGKFLSFFEFCELVDHRKINRRVIESLIKSGALDTIDPKRGSLYQSIDAAMAWALKRRDEEGLGQTNLLSLIDSTKTQSGEQSIAKKDPWLQNERLAFEKEALGFYLSDHPLKNYEGEIRRLTTTDTQLCQSLSQQTEVILAGLVIQSKVIRTKKGSPMAFLTFEDLVGSIEVVVFSEVFQRGADLFSEQNPLVIKGVIDRSDEGAKIIAREVYLLTSYLRQKTKSIHFKIPVSSFTEERLRDLNQILNEYEGPCRGYLHFVQAGESDTVMELERGLHLRASEALVDRVNSLFGEKVVEFGL